MDRRRLLSVLAVGLAGCSSSSDGTTTTATETATPTPSPGAESLRAFRRAVAGLALDIRTLESTPPLVSLAYTTQKRQYQEMADQIGLISGLFFKRYRSGWDVTRLDATASVDDGSEFTWHARTEWYDSFAADEITAEELTFKVLDTVERG